MDSTGVEGGGVQVRSTVSEASAQGAGLTGQDPGRFLGPVSPGIASEARLWVLDT